MIVIVSPSATETTRPETELVFATVLILTPTGSADRHMQQATMLDAKRLIAILFMRPHLFVMSSSGFTPFQTSEKAGKQNTSSDASGEVLRMTLDDTTEEAKLHGRQCPSSCVTQMIGS